MTEPSDATGLDATKRDILVAVAASDAGPGNTTVAEVRATAVNLTERVQEKRNGKFYHALDALEEQGYLTTSQNPDNDITDLVTLTEEGEEAIEELAERSDNIPR